jgi:hypothetical protein
MHGYPWVALPFGKNKEKLMVKVQCQQYPHPGVVSADGKVINDNVWDEISSTSVKKWLQQC